MVDARFPRRRDGQQWILDYLIKSTGRVQTFERDARMLPAEVKSHAMIPKVLGKRGHQEERLAVNAEGAGHDSIALLAYAAAVRSYVGAQHAIYERNRFDEKRYWYQQAIACNERIRALADHPIERLEIPWGQHRLPAHLHIQPDRQRRPTILFIPGMDGTKETSGIGPLAEIFMPHDVNVISMDGPGQGESLLRGAHVTDSNYESAISAAIDVILDRPEVDAERFAVVGRSFGSFWALRSAGADERIKAVAVDAVCFGDKTAIFDRASPRFKQIFMMMAGIDDESEFDRVAARMTMEGHGQQIICPALISAGEFDPLTSIDEVEDLFTQIAGPKELWILEDQFHSYSDIPALAGIDNLHFMIEWVLDALEGRLTAGHGRMTLVGSDGGGPYEEVNLVRPWQMDASGGGNRDG